MFLDPAYGSRQNATHIMLLVTDIYEDLGDEWKRYFLGNVSLLNSTTNVQRFSMWHSLPAI